MSDVLDHVEKWLIVLLAVIVIIVLVYSMKSTFSTPTTMPPSPTKLMSLPSQTPMMTSASMKLMPFPSLIPLATPSQTPLATPSQTPLATPSQTPVNQKELSDDDIARQNLLSFYNSTQNVSQQRMDCSNSLTACSDQNTNNCNKYVDALSFHNKKYPNKKMYSNKSSCILDCDQSRGAFVGLCPCLHCCKNVCDSV